MSQAPGLILEVIAFRLIYYELPAVLAAIAALRVPRELQMGARQWAQNAGFQTPFCPPPAIKAQRVSGAFVLGQILAFVSVHHNNCEWVRDLIRKRNASPPAL